MMRNTCWVLIAVMALLVGCGKKVNEHSTPAVETPGIVSDTYLLSINSHRIKLGLNPLEISLIIEEQAFEHARAMAGKRRAFGHYGKALRCRKIRDEFATGFECGEIIAMGPKTAQDLYKYWINSSTHRQLLEASHYTHTGLGYETDPEGVTYWTQIFYSAP